MNENIFNLFINSKIFGNIDLYINTIDITSSFKQNVYKYKNIWYVMKNFFKGNKCLIRNYPERHNLMSLMYTLFAFMLTMKLYKIIAHCTIHVIRIVRAFYLLAVIYVKSTQNHNGVFCDLFVFETDRSRIVNIKQKRWIHLFI